MMRTIRIIAQILILYVFYYIGVFIIELTGLPLPPSILGLLVLVICLKFEWVKVDLIRDGASFLIGFMTLFFIPPMVGIIDYPQLLSLDGFILIATVVISTLFVIYITSFITQKIEKKELAAKLKESDKKENQESNSDEEQVNDELEKVGNSKGGIEN